MATSTNYPNIWDTILNQPGTQNVDIIASINEEGINHFLEQHQNIDKINYHKEIKKVFNTQTDKREFTINLDITSPIQVQFPPYKNPAISNEFKNKDNWLQLDSHHEGPQLYALKDEPNKIQVYCNEVNITLTWPKLNPKPGDIKTWEVKLKTMKVYAEAFAILKNEQDDFYISLIPKIIKFDVNDPLILVKSLAKKNKVLPKTEIKLLDECQDKLTDLTVIALNILATEQAPKLVRNIRIPIPVIKNKPILPSVFYISENCLTVGAGIDKVKAERTLQVEYDKYMVQLKARIDEDINSSGGLLQIISTNKLIPKNFNELEIKSHAEIKKAFIKTNEFIEELQSNNKNNQKVVQDKIPNSALLVDNGYAVGINEYFFDNILNSVMPSPKHECSGWLNLEVVKGRACYWIKFYDPDVSINPNASLTGSVSIDIGGSIEACIRKIWDCSWSWECGSLAISVKGRPNINIKLLNSNGIRIAAKMGGSLYLDVNLPFPFNKIINALTSIIGDFVIAMINIVLGLISFVVIYPELTLPEQLTKLKLRDFNSFNYNRPQIPGNEETKNKFLGFRGGLIAEK